MWRLFAVTLLLLGDVPAVSINLVPNVLFANAALRLTCHVPRDGRNRWLEYGLANYTTSFVPLEGTNARITFQTTYPHVPCDPGVAYCRVGRLDGSTSLATANLEVSGCN